MNKILIALSVALFCGAGIFVYAAHERTRAVAQQEHTEATLVKFSPLFDAATFELTDQNGKTFSSHDLAGKVWIADFIFTNCGGPCPLMTSKLQAISRKISSPDVKFISFSVDPKRDTPAVLNEYAKKFGIDDPRWSFLTGTSEQMATVARGMNIAAKQEDDQSVTHSTQFLLVNRDGKVCGIYRLNDDDLATKLPADAMELSGGKLSGKNSGK